MSKRQILQLKKQGLEQLMLEPQGEASAVQVETAMAPETVPVRQRIGIFRTGSVVMLCGNWRINGVWPGRRWTT